MSNHAANIDTSDRLKKLIAYLSGREDGATTFELCLELATTNPARDASECNCNFITRSDPRRIICSRCGKSENGRAINRFQIVNLEEEKQI